MPCCRARRREGRDRLPFVLSSHILTRGTPSVQSSVRVERRFERSREPQSRHPPGYCPSTGASRLRSMLLGTNGRFRLWAALAANAERLEVLMRDLIPVTAIEPGETVRYV